MVVCPEYEELARRHVAAHRQAHSLVRETAGIRALASILREAQKGEAVLVRCAWCDRVQVGEEWLQLEAVGTGRQRLSQSIRDKASHGICPSCFEAEMRRAERERSRGANEAT